LAYGAGAAHTLRLMSPHAPSVLPMFLITAWNVGLRSVLRMPCSWYVWRVVRRRVPLPCVSARSSMVRYSLLGTVPAGRVGTPGCVRLVTYGPYWLSSTEQCFDCKRTS
jgi:hypothetical protein